MEKLNNYSLKFDSYNELNLDKVVCNSEDKNSSLRASVFLSIAFAGTMTLNPVHTATKYEIKNSDFSIESISLEKSQQLSLEISEYSKSLFKTLIANKSLIVEEIISFKSLENSWDGFGALPLGVKSATKAISLLDSFDMDILVKISDIHPNPNGTITFDWENKDAEIVSLEIGKDTFTYFVDFNSIETKFYNNQNFSFENIKMLKEYISAI